MSSSDKASSKGDLSAPLPASEQRGLKRYLGSEQAALPRALRPRHLTFIAIGGTIGTGIFLSVGSSVATAGAGGALVSCEWPGQSALRTARQLRADLSAPPCFADIVVVSALHGQLVALHADHLLLRYRDSSALVRKSRRWTGRRIEMASSPFFSALQASS